MVIVHKSIFKTIFLIFRFEGDTKEANALSDKHDADIRDLGKKIQSYEVEFDETNDKLTKAMTNLEEREKAFKNAEEEVCFISCLFIHCKCFSCNFPGF